MNNKNFLVKIEEEILSFWKKKKIFEKTLNQRNNKKEFVFYEGPPSANAKPGLHHALSRSYKDIICRFKSMEGFYVKRKAGWDTHGLPIELQVEKKFNFKNKQDILKFGIKKFNQECKKLVFLYKEDWDKLTERMGYWVDLKNPYITLDTPYIENLWFLIKKLFEKGLLYKGYRISPYCPRCQTVLSSHEVAQEYKKVKENTIYVKLETERFLNNSFGKTYLLVWTTTPWTLPANIAVAINPKFEYVLVRFKKENFIVLKDLAKNVFGSNYKILEKLKGEELIGLKYKRLFKSKKFKEKKGAKAFEVVSGNFVGKEEGTGLVHLAPAFGDDDNKVLAELRDKGSKNDFPVFITVNEKGEMEKGVIGGGLFVKDADKIIIEELKKKNLLFKEEEYSHDYPFCWRCKTPLLYYPRESWFVKMSSLRDKLLSNNNKINWVPSHIKKGRFGEWLREVKDWAFSRDRFWGTPLPIWYEDGGDEVRVIGSLEKLKKYSYYKNIFYLLRHGEAKSNSSDMIVSKETKTKKFPLTTKGKKDVQKVIQQLKKEKIDLIFASPLTRTKQTAEIISKTLKIPVKFDKRLLEIQTGVFNLKPIRDYLDYFDNNKERLDKRPIDGENLKDVAKRAISFVNDINRKYQDKKILIISHGDLLQMMSGKMNGKSWQESIRSKVFNLAELRKYEWSILPFNEDLEIDLHRPYIDKIVLKSKDGRKMFRDNRVADVWFDSGSMPLAQNYGLFKKYKSKPLKEVAKKISFPADYISEGIDQTRGWFYTLLAVSTALGLGPSYKNVICLGHVLDPEGQKMSKSKGNIVDPFYVLNTYGADALRWYFYNFNPAGEPKKFDQKDLQTVLRRFILTYWNVFNFWQTYKPKLLDKKLNKRFLAVKVLPKNKLSSWIVSRLEQTKEAVKSFMDNYDVYQASLSLDNFLDDFSRWYLRRSRKTLQKQSFDDWRIFTFVLAEFTKIVSPFIPFVSEKIWQGLSIDKEKESVHLADFPKADKNLIDKKILKEMELIRSIAGQVLSLRKEENIRLRQPLSILVYDGPKISQKILGILREEINIKEIKAREIRSKEKKEWLFSENDNFKIALNPEITLSLKIEGMSRDLIRQIQVLRNELKLTPNDLIDLGIVAKNKESEMVLDAYSKKIKLETKTKNLYAIELKNFESLKEDSNWIVTLKVI